MFKKTFIVTMVAVMALAVAAPSIAFASRGSDDDDNDDRRGRSEDRRSDDDDHFSDDKIFGLDFSRKHREGRVDDSIAPRGAVKGQVVTKTDTGFTLEGRRDSVITVNTSSATFVKLPNTTISLADLVVGDYVVVMGTRTGLNVDATKVMVIPANLRKAEAKGTVTAVSGNDISLLTKKGQTVTVKADANTKISGDHNSPAVVGDIEVGSKLKIHGIWDSITNILNAIRIKIKS